MNFDRRNKVGTALVAIAVVLFVLPALFPVQAVLVHDTRGSIGMADEADIEERGLEVVAYENLSDRGQELYRETLRNGGEYRVSIDRGAPDFDYATAEEVREARENGDYFAPSVVIERPPEGETDLPPARGVRIPPEARERMSEEELERLERLDMMRTTQRQPPLGSTQQLLRLGSVMLAVVLLGLGGYFLSSK